MEGPKEGNQEAEPKQQGNTMTSHEGRDEGGDKPEMECLAVFKHQSGS